MKTALRFLLALLAGFLVGSLVNMGLILLGGKVVPPPPGASVTTMEGLKASIHLFQAKHFLFPFLAHALGTLAGAFLAAWLTPSRRPGPAFSVSGLFFVGGLVNCIAIPAPAWFMAVDLLLAYVPMAWLGWRWAPR